MKIEKLTEDRIKVTLNLQDLQEKNLDFHSLMSNPIESQSLFIDMLDEAERRLGFDTENYKIMVEALAMSDGNFIFNITRVTPEKDKPAKYKLHTKRKNYNLTQNKNIYCFNNFEDFCNFCNSFYVMNHSLFQDFSLKSSLFLLDNKYYLVICNSDNKYNNSLLIEFASVVEDSELWEKKLLEYGKELMHENAINLCLKYFKSVS